MDSIINQNESTKSQKTQQVFDLKTAYVMMLKAYIRQHQEHIPGLRSACDAGDRNSKA